jgi:hypothetical protein
MRLSAAFSITGHEQPRRIELLGEQRVDEPGKFLASPRQDTAHPRRRQAGMTSSANRRRERSVCVWVRVPKQKEPTK